MNLEIFNDRTQFPGADCPWPFDQGSHFGTVETIDLGNGVQIEVSGGVTIKSAVNKRGFFPVNFNPGEVLIFTERDENSRVGAIRIDFLTPVTAAGAQIAVDLASNNKPFRGIMAAFSGDTKHEIIAEGLTKRMSPPDALFFGAVCAQGERITRLEFDVRPNGASAPIKRFAISNLKIRA